MKYLYVLFAWCFPLVALAHVSFDHAEPKVGSKVSASPKEVKIWFSNDVDPSLCSIEVFDTSGKQIDKKDTHVDKKDGSLVIVSMPDLPPGTYKVMWKAACVDKHKVKGNFKFEITR